MRIIKPILILNLLLEIIFFLFLAYIYHQSQMKVIQTHELQPPLRRLQNYSYNPSHMMGAGNFSKVYSGRN